MAFVIPSVFSAIDKFTAPLEKMQRKLGQFGDAGDSAAARVERRFRKLGDGAMNVAKKGALIGTAVAAPLILAANEAIKFEDRMADVGKTTGLQGKALQSFGEDLLALAPYTRTSIEELQKIAAIGGQMGITDQKDLIAFTASVDKFNVALGSDFSGGVEEASKQVSGLKNLFKETRSVKIDEAITKAGSAINALSSKGVSVAGVTDFLNRVGQLPDAIKPSIQNTAALGAVFDKAGVTSEIAARALGDILITGAQNLPKFAKQMGMTQEATSKLINSDPAAFASQFANSLNGLDAEGLSKTLKALKIGDTGSIKAIGALASSTEMLKEFQGIANKEFAAGTSLLNEYNTKNNTTAANIEKAKNNFQALSIVIGTQLLPVVSDILKSVIPAVQGVTKWAKENPKLLSTVLGLTVGIVALSYTVSAVAGAIALFSNIMVVWANLSKVVTAVQWAWNAAMTANPIGLIIVGIAALIALVVVIIAKWNEWGAALALVAGPIGWIISLIQSFRRNWDMITDAFSQGGILAGIKAIGVTLLDAVLMPLQQIVSLIADITGAEWATNAVKSIEDFRKGLGVNVATDESGAPLPGATDISTKSAEQEALAQRMESTQKQSVTMDINNNTGFQASISSDNDIVPISLSSTMPGGR